jgi:hypothetical protein
MHVNNIKGTLFPFGFTLCISDGVHAWTACPSKASIAYSTKHFQDNES